MIIPEEEAKKDKSIKDYVDLSHEELELPEIDNMDEYASIGNEVFRGLTMEEVQAVFTFLEQLRQKK